MKQLRCLLSANSLTESQNTFELYSANLLCVSLCSSAGNCFEYLKTHTCDLEIFFHPTGEEFY